jgi:ATP-dependent helicase/nuclease subunit A
LKDSDKKIEQWNDASTNTNWLLKDYERAAAGCYLDWVGPALVRHQDSIELRKNEIQNPLIPDGITCHDSAWKITIMHAEEIKNQEVMKSLEEDTFLEKVENQETIPVTSPYKEEIESRLTWEYSFANASTHRSKQSVSEMKRQREMSDEHSGTELLSSFKKSITKRPKFMQEKALSPAERGTALHMVMQHVDLTRSVTIDSVKTQIESMVHNELLTVEQAEVVDIHLIGKFFESDLGKRILNANAVNREIPFTLSLPASEVYPTWKDQDESVFVQGIIDCVFEDENGLVLLDFKSDGINDRYKGGFEQAKPILEQRYRLQINLYTKALEKIWKRKVNERYLFFFDGAHILKIDEENE